MASVEKKWEDEVLRARSVAAAQQEDDKQDRDGHAKSPQQDVAKLALLLPAPLLQSFHTYLRARLERIPEGSKGRAGMRPLSGFDYVRSFPE
jgi:hypothetical protein